MQRSKLRLAAAIALGALGGAWLAGVAFAQGATAEEPDVSEQKEEFERVLDTRAKGNTAASSAQKRVEQISDETDELLAKYRTTWKQIESIETYNQQMRELIAAQQQELASLSDQLERVQIVSRSVTPLMLRMISAVEHFVDLDVPFLIEERRERVEQLHTLMNRADVTTAEKFRQIMEAYQIENEYGRTIEAYRDSLDIEGRETTVDFLRFGRIALVYQSLDEQQRGVWDQEARTFVPLGSEYRTAIRNGLRIARKQAAPDLIPLPLPAPSDARESS